MIMDLVNELSAKNPILYYFGIFCGIGAIVCLFLTQFNNTQVLGINAWIKPAKFFISSMIFSVSMAWYMRYLPEQNQVKIYSWVVVLILFFELVYITIMAAKGERSHFNVSTPTTSVLWSAMGLFITIMTFHTAFIAFLFFKNDFPELAPSYLWAIRFGIVLFVIFALEGGVMGANNAHTVGAADGGKGIPFLNWSITHGDLRIAHFFGMHALQVLPLLAFYFIKDVKTISIIAVLYFLLSVFVLIQALNGRPFIKF